MMQKFTYWIDIGTLVRGKDIKNTWGLRKTHIRRPSASILSYKEWNGIGVDEIE